MKNIKFSIGFLALISVVSLLLGISILIPRLKHYTDKDKKAKEYIETAYNLLDETLPEENSNYYEENSDEEMIVIPEQQKIIQEVYKSEIELLPSDSYLKFLKSYEADVMSTLENLGIISLDLEKSVYLGYDYIYYIAEDSNGMQRYVRFDCNDFKLENIQLLHYNKDGERPYEIPDGDTDLFMGIILGTIDNDMFQLLPSQYCSLLAQARDLLGLQLVFSNPQYVTVYTDGTLDNGHNFIQFYADSTGVFITAEDVGESYAIHNDAKPDSIFYIRKDSIQKADIK